MRVISTVVLLLIIAVASAPSAQALCAAYVDDEGEAETLLGVGLMESRTGVEACAEWASQKCYQVYTTCLAPERI